MVGIIAAAHFAALARDTKIGVKYKWVNPLKMLLTRINTFLGIHRLTSCWSSLSLSLGPTALTWVSAVNPPETPLDHCDVGDLATGATTVAIGSPSN